MAERGHFDGGTKVMPGQIAPGVTPNPAKLSRQMKVILEVMEREEAVGEPYLTLVQIMTLMWPEVSRRVDFGTFQRRYQVTHRSMIGLEKSELVRRAARLKGPEIGWATASGAFDSGRTRPVPSHV